MNALRASIVFLLINVAVLLIILVLNRRAGFAGRQPPSAPAQPADQQYLESPDILGWEFEYARTTASEAMQDRHTMVNFYLLAAGVVASGVIGVLGSGADIPRAVGTALLWLLCEVGWLYFLKLVRLRQAWHDSARAMNQIKEFYFRHVKDTDGDILRSAFRWQAHTQPAPDRPWTVFFYSAMLIGLLNSAAFVAGGVLLDADVQWCLTFQILRPLAVLGVAFFAFHVCMYFAFLAPKPPKQR